MSYQTRPGARRTESEDYNTGYADGVRAAIEEQELDAYYAGVGFGKKAAGDRHIGFNSEREREQFNAGMRNKDKHFKTFRVEKPSLWERLFGNSETHVGFKISKKEARRERRDAVRKENRHDREVARTKKRERKAERKSRKAARKKYSKRFRVQR